MQSIITFIVMLSILPAAALGHDIYIFQTGVVEEFQFAQIGWIWEHYSQQTLDDLFYTLSDTDPMIWNAFVDPFLAQQAFFAALSPLGFYLAIIIAMKVFGIGTFEGEGLFQSK